MRWDSVGELTGWDLVEKRGPGLPPQLRYQDKAKSALLKFRGGRFLTVLKAQRWSGTVTIRRQSGTQRVVKLQESNPDNVIVLEDPVAQSSAGIYAAAIIVFGGCAFWFGPIRERRRSLGWLVFSLSALHLLFWATQCIGTNNDSPEYVSDASWLRSGFPSYFPPGYPVLVGLMKNITGPNLGVCVTLIQHGMVVLAAVWLYWFLRELMSEELAFSASVLAGALAPSMTVPQAVISETTTFFAMAGALYYAYRSAETGRLGFLVAGRSVHGMGRTGAHRPPVCIDSCHRPHPRVFLLHTVVETTWSDGSSDRGGDAPSRRVVLV